MRTVKCLRVIALLALCALSLVQLGCDDAQSAALSLFSRQGLNLLRPARDYIQPGGLVFVPKNGHPEYDDPKDPVTPEKGNLIDFRASILQQTQNDKTGLSAALSLASTIIPMPISAGVQTSKDVSLKQIDTTGLRLNTNDLETLMGAPKTSKAAKAELARGTRVFLVQEIYKATSLDLSAADSKAFDLHFNDGKAVADCKDTSSSGTTSNGNTPNKKDLSSNANAKSSASTGAPKKTGDKGDDSTGKGQSGAMPSPSPANTPSKLGAGVGVCIAEKFTLKLQTKDPIPFAVRLAELELSQGVLQRKRGKVLTGTLGGGEISADLVSDQSPVLDGLTRRGKSSK